MKVSWILGAAAFFLLIAAVLGLRLILLLKRESFRIEQDRRLRADHYLQSGLDPERWEAK